MNAEIERQFVNGFVVKSKQPRTIHELSSQSKRDRFTSRIGFHLERSTFHLIEVKDVSSIYRRLKEEGASDTCYLISLNADRDGREFPLMEALHTLDYEFEILICLPVELAFFRETPSQSHLLKRH